MSVKWQEFYSARARGMKTSEIRELLKLASKQDIISFAGGLPDPALFPLAHFQEVTDFVLEQKGKKALQYSETEGLGELRELLAERSRAEGVLCDAENIIITSASQQGLDLAAKVLLDAGDTCLLEAPSYLGAIQAFNAYQGRPVGIPLDDEGLRVDLLETKLRELRAEAIRPKFLYVVPNFQNPSGVTLSMERRQRLVEIAARWDLLIIEDDPYGALRFSGEPLPSLKALDPDNRVIHLRTFSKTLAPGIRLGWIIADKPFVRQIAIAKQATDLCTPALTQHIAYEFCRRGYLEEYVARVREEYQRKCQCMLAAMDEFFPAAVHWPKPTGGMFVWATAPAYLDTVEMFPRAREAKVAYVIGSVFYADGSGRNAMRLNFSLPTLEQIPQGIMRLGSLLRAEIASHEGIVTLEPTRVH
ncbi:MAG: PLP-dependent aminotransferase family protein [Chloroflexi bacterium]|nr:PLP-dependent aminotransferase family protein [Chloroflexota bacterium]